MHTGLILAYAVLGKARTEISLCRVEVRRITPLETTLSGCTSPRVQMECRALFPSNYEGPLAL